MYYYNSRKRFLDITGAFDNISHQGILEGLANTNCGERTYKYIQSFLSQRTAELKIGELQTPAYQSPNKGTLQGAVISPTLFNVAMVGLARKLQEVEGLRHAFYADEIMTLWTTKGSLAEKEERLQTAAHIIQDHIIQLQCSPEKSEILRVWRSRRNHAAPTDPSQKLDVYLNGNLIHLRTEG